LVLDGGQVGKHNQDMFVTPVASQGDIVVGRDKAGRVLRVSGHSGFDRVVLSIWQEGQCLATVRLAGADIPDLVRILTGTAMAQPVTPPPLSAAG
jgi:hypothetical protein